LIDLDVAESEASNFEKMWPEALQKLKSITENS
jgi:predicted NUDIX family NTP pyrophosphohydrolase